MRYRYGSFYEAAIATRRLLVSHFSVLVEGVEIPTSFILAVCKVQLQILFLVPVHQAISPVMHLACGRSQVNV